MQPTKTSTTGLGLDQRVILYTGHDCAVQDVRPGMQLLGPDSQPREVLSVHTGTDWLYKCDPTTGSDPFTASASQLLSLNKRSVIRHSNKDHWHKRYTVLETVQSYKNKPSVFMESHRLWRPTITFASEKEYGFREAYEKGLSAVKEGKLAREDMLTSIENRKELIAGVLDAGGKIRKIFHNEYSFKHDSEQLVESLAFLLRSLDVGINVHRPTWKSHGERNQTSLVVCSCLPGVHFRKLALREHRHKRVAPSRARLLIRPLWEGEYHGFTLLGDQLYMLRDFTVLCAAPAVL